MQYPFGIIGYGKQSLTIMEKAQMCKKSGIKKQSATASEDAFVRGFLSAVKVYNSESEDSSCNVQHILHITNISNM